MDKKLFKKIIAQSPEDLKIISALTSEGEVKEIRYLKKNKIFLLSLERDDKENIKESKTIFSIIIFKFIESAKSKNFDIKKDDFPKLLAIELLKKNDNFQIFLLFEKNLIINLLTEAIDVELIDQKYADD